VSLFVGCIAVNIACKIRKTAFSGWVYFGVLMGLVFGMTLAHTYTEYRDGLNDLKSGYAQENGYYYNYIPNQLFKIIYTHDQSKLFSECMEDCDLIQYEERAGVKQTLALMALADNRFGIMHNVMNVEEVAENLQNSIITGNSIDMELLQKYMELQTLMNYTDAVTLFVLDILSIICAFILVIMTVQEFGCRTRKIALEE
jgi:hypothetical protein